jgi:hypothetical protein
MKLYFVTPDTSPLADANLELIDGLRAQAKAAGLEVVNTPADADGVIINEAFSFKEQRYVQRLLGDPIAGRFAQKLYTVNFDDCATGLLRGLYSSLPRRRFDSNLHAAIPYYQYHNALVFSGGATAGPQRFLAAWRGNEISNRIRGRLLDLYRQDPRFALESTASWYNHGEDEKSRYVAMIVDAQFSLCPGGIAPVSFRIFESMALGRAPVLIADEFVYPQGLDWPAFSLTVPERSVGKLASILHAERHRAAQMGRKAREAWDSHFSRGRILEYFLREISKLIRNAPRSTRAQEARRWHSWAMWRTNGWTIPQRAWRKVKRSALSARSGSAAPPQR